VNINAAGYFRLILNQNTAINLPGYLAGGNGTEIVFWLIQGTSCTGNCIPTFNSIVKWQGGSHPVWSTTPGYRDQVVIRWDAYSQAYYATGNVGYQN
jgi:hypothetical protein